MDQSIPAPTLNIDYSSKVQKCNGLRLSNTKICESMTTLKNQFLCFVVSVTIISHSPKSWVALKSSYL